MAIKIINRSLNIPVQDRNIGFTGDNLVETRSFELTRIYAGVDLSKFDFKLDTEINGVKNIIDLDKSVNDDKITLTWTIRESHILTPGRMAIQLRAFSGDEEKWHSAQDYVLVQASINATEAQPDPLPSEFVQMEARVTAAKNEAIEAAHEAKQQAERVEGIIREAEQDVLPELRQAIEDGIETKNQLGGSIQEAGEAKTALDGSISSAGTAKGELDGSITEANTTKGQLDDSIDLAGNAKTDLDGSITAAGQTKQALDESIATGDLDSFKAEYAAYKDSNSLKVAKIEKDLNDYQQTMAGVNVNQEATQSVSGYGIISLPPNAANGQVSGVVRGLTATNLVENGDFAKGLEGWFFGGKELNDGVTNTTVSEGELTFTATEFTGRCYRRIEFDSTDMIYRRALVKANSNLVGLGETTYVLQAHSGSGKYELLSHVKCDTPNYISVVDRRTSDFDSISAKEIMVVNLTQVFGAGNEPTKEECDQIFANYFDGTKSTIGSARISSADDTGEVKDKAYVTAVKDNKIVNLRSLPNGIKDEISLSEKKAIIKIGTKTDVVSGTVINYTDMADGGQFVAYYEDGTQQAGVKGDTLTATATSLIYQLATPVEIPVQVSGTLVGYPNGTVYIEPYVADAGIYTDKMEVLYSDLPIKALEKISKVDFESGLETELDIAEAIIAEDKLSFTHPDLTSGDIVFFVYEHGAEGTISETEISYYDSRYVIKGEDDKFYQWEIEAKLVEGVITPSIKLVEV